MKTKETGWLLSTVLPASSRGFPAAAQSMCLFSAVLLTCVSAAAGASISWTLPGGQYGNWAAASNWGGSVPGAEDTAYIANGGTATVSAFMASCGTLALGGSAATAPCK